VLLNIECTLETLRELEAAFKFNDAVLRSLVIRRDKAITTPSPLYKEKEKEEGSRSSGASTAPAASSEPAAPAQPTPQPAPAAAAEEATPETAKE